MTTTVSAIGGFIRRQDRSVLAASDLLSGVNELLAGEEFKRLLLALIEAPAFSPQLGEEFASAGAIPGISPCRVLRGSLNLTLSRFLALLATLISAIDPSDKGRPGASAWSDFADRVHGDPRLSKVKLLTHLTTRIDDPSVRAFYATLAERLIEDHPHAVYPTSDYRECDGHVQSTEDGMTIEAVTSFKTFATLKIVDGALDIDQPALRNVYKPLGRCVCLVDENVEAFYGRDVDAYFEHHDIRLEKRVYRAMEADKGILTVETMLGDFKALGVSRNEPVLIVGGGVLADAGGLACALYGRNTPYVMLATSIVTGIDAGPSPRTCCDGFGYKNLMGAYHPPVLCLTDRFFFKTLREGWVRHGVAEIIKMGVVKDAALFADLETAQGRLVETRFGTVECKPGDEMHALSQRILGRALSSYVAAEYDNLYETHQCRPHAYGHTWSPGFEIEAGLLHGHAVSVCMGFGAYLSHRRGWIGRPDLDRILALLDGCGLSLWHDILHKKETIWQSQQTVVQKRGQNLVAPVPKGEIGRCGYLNELSQDDLYAALDEYETICVGYPRMGRGIEPLCSDVGLESPSTMTPAAATRFQAGSRTDRASPAFVCDQSVDPIKVAS